MTPVPGRQHVWRLHWLVRHAAAGAIVGWLVLGALLVTDAAGLRSLLTAGDLPVVAIVAVAAQFAVGFAAFAVATACALPPDRPSGRERPVAAGRQVRARISAGRGTRG